MPERNKGGQGIEWSSLLTSPDQSHSQAPMRSNIVHVHLTCLSGPSLLCSDVSRIAVNSVIHSDETGRTMSPSRDMKYQWLHDISAGIQYLHFYDIIHRDLKPHNILLSMSSDIEGSGRLVAKITDFGVSSVAGIA